MRRALAHDDVTIEAGLSVVLRPTLRAAMRLERRFAGFETIFRDLEELKLSTFAAIIEECAVDPMAASAFMAHIASKPIGVTLHNLQGPLIALSLQLTGASIDDDPVEKPKSKAPSRTSFAQSLEKLFEAGTGWIGWTPAETWQSTPAEIIAAYSGLCEKLRAIHGAAEPPKDERTVADKFRDIFAARSRAGESA